MQSWLRTRVSSKVEDSNSVTVCWSMKAVAIDVWRARGRSWKAGNCLTIIVRTRLSKRRYDISYVLQDLRCFPCGKFSDLSRVVIVVRKIFSQRGGRRNAQSDFAIWIEECKN